MSRWSPVRIKSCISKSSTATASPVSSSALQHGECGNVSSYVLPCSAFPVVPLIGDELELGISLASANEGLSSSTTQRNLSNGFSPGVPKVHLHELDSDLPEGRGATTPIGQSTEWRGLPSIASAPSLFQECAGPALSSSSSSIGVAGEHSFSSEHGSDDNSGDGEVQSARRGPINLSSLEDSLPIKRGLSCYFIGQSKSFGCLSDALSTGLAKPANPYAKRRKNFSLEDDRHRSFPPVSRKSASGISKKNSFGNKSNLALAVAMEAALDEEEEEGGV